MKQNYHQMVYDITASIPKGRASTYGAIADYLALGSARMVGWALNQLDFSDGDVPAHRVVNSKGELSGRNAFSEPDTMQKRLEAEGIVVKNDKIQNFKEVFWHPQELDKLL